MALVHIIRIDLAIQGFQLHGTHGRVGRVPKKLASEVLRFLVVPRV